MDAVQQPEIRTSNGEPVPATGAKRPEVRPDDHPVLTKGSIREREEHWITRALKALGFGGDLPLPQLSSMVAVVYIACQILKADGLDGNQKLIGIGILALTLAILGLATLIPGAKTHATITKNDADKSAHP